MIEHYASVQDMIGIAILTGVVIKAYQFNKEGKFKHGPEGSAAHDDTQSAAATVDCGGKAKRCPSAGAGRIQLLIKQGGHKP